MWAEQQDSQQLFRKSVVSFDLKTDSGQSKHFISLSLCEFDSWSVFVICLLVAEFPNWKYRCLLSQQACVWSVSSSRKFPGTPGVPLILLSFVLLSVYTQEVESYSSICPQVFSLTEPSVIMLPQNITLQLFVMEWNWSGFYQNCCSAQLTYCDSIHSLKSGLNIRYPVKNLSLENETLQFAVTVRIHICYIAFQCWHSFTVIKDVWRSN